VEFEATMPEVERTKTVHASDGAATAGGIIPCSAESLEASEYELRSACSRNLRDYLDVCPEELKRTTKIASQDS
jgi:hypothetical protein